MPFNQSVTVSLFCNDDETPIHPMTFCPALANKGKAILGKTTIQECEAMCSGIGKIISFENKKIKDMMIDSRSKRSRKPYWYNSKLNILYLFSFTFFTFNKRLGHCYPRIKVGLYRGCLIYIINIQSDQCNAKINDSETLSMNIYYKKRHSPLHHWKRSIRKMWTLKINRWNNSWCFVFLLLPDGASKRWEDTRQYVNRWEVRTHLKTFLNERPFHLIHNKPFWVWLLWLPLNLYNNENFIFLSMLSFLAPLIKR